MATGEAMQPSGALQYEGNNFDGAVLPGRPQRPTDLAAPEEMMRLAVSQPSEPATGTTRESCELVLLISSAAGYERRRKTVRATYLSLLREDSADSPLTLEQRKSIRYKFLLGAPKPDQVAALQAEQEEHGDLLQVAVPESYESLWPKLVACWRWAHATYDFRFWMHADDDSFLRPELLLRYLSAPETPQRGLYAGYIWDGSEGRRTKPLRDPSAKSFMPPEQWPHDFYPPFASGCGFIISHDLIAWLVSESADFTFFRVIDVPVGIYLAQLPEREARLAIRHLETVRPYRPLPLFREDSMVQHYMQPEEFPQFFESSYGGAAKSKEDAESDARIAQVYDLFVNAKVMRR